MFVKKFKHMLVKKIIWIIIIVLAIVIGLYPLSFIGADTNIGLLGHKSKELLANTIWNIAFYIHISLGGFSLLIGWLLFLKKFRKKNINWHRTIGKVYIISVLLSAIAGYFIAYHATGGIVAKFGFAGMSTSWLITTFAAYAFIRKKEIEKHQKWMIRSYAVTFVGVTFRLWMPFLIIAFNMEFLEAYPISSWLSWIANLIVAEIIIRSSISKIKVVTTLSQAS